MREVGVSCSRAASSIRGARARPRAERWRRSTAAPCLVISIKLSPSSAESLRVLDRKRVRPDPDRPVEVQVMGPDDLDVLYARDISEAGIGVFMPHGFDGLRLRAEIELIVRLPEASPFAVGGVLRHRTINGPLAFFGVEFIRVADSARQSLRSYVQARLAAEAETRAHAPSRTV